jgi:hypothetical protein
MSNFEHLGNIGKTVDEIYISKNGEGEVEKLCESLEGLRGKFDTAIVVLTAGLNKTGASTDNYVTEFIARLREAAAALKYKELLASGKHPVIIPSGGQIYGNKADAPNLAEIMKAEIISKYGINPDDIQTEPYSIDTSENARFSAKILKTLGFEKESDEENKPVYLITSQFHLDRATFLFNQYFNGDLNSLNAEQTLIDFVQKFSNGKTKNPYKKVVEKFNASLENKKLTEKDKMFNIIEASPLGEELLRALAFYLRHLEGDPKKIPSVKQQKKN